MRELAGARGSADSKHQNQNRRHEELEELAAHSPTALFRPERSRSSVAAWEDRERVGEIQNRVGKTARAWFLRLGWKNEARGITRSFIGLGLISTCQIPGESGFWLAPESDSAPSREEGRRRADVWGRCGSD